MLGTPYFVVVSCLNTCMSKEEVLVDTPTTNKSSGLRVLPAMPALRIPEDRRD